MSEERQYFDPYQLIREVGFLLNQHGLDVEVEQGKLGDAAAGAGMLLRAFGVTPAMDVRDTFDRKLTPYW